MPAKDSYHDAVKAALIEDGWLVTADPFPIKYKEIELYADLAAERPIAAERGNEKIVVEIKSFVGRALMTDFHNAIGQYMVYRSLMPQSAPDYRLYLAIDDITYNNFFTRSGIDFLIQANQVSLLVVDIEQREIVTWRS